MKKEQKMPVAMDIYRAVGRTLVEPKRPIIGRLDKKTEIPVEKKSGR